MKTSRLESRVWRGCYPKPGARPTESLSRGRFAITLKAHRSSSPSAQTMSIAMSIGCSPSLQNRWTPTDPWQREA